MAEYYSALNEQLRTVIDDQKIYFVASAVVDGNVNLSPKGYNTFKVIDNNTACYLDYPGSGNETAVHSSKGGRITIMFCSFTKKPLILRLYGMADAIRKDDDAFSKYAQLFSGENMSIVRQIVLIKIRSVMTSCGYGVPFFDYVGEREHLKNWAHNKEKQGTLTEYMG